MDTKKQGLTDPGQVLTLSIRDPERFIFKGVVNTVSTFNDRGPFDVLPYHENFITSIKNKLVVRIHDGIKEFPIEKGIMKVEFNNVQVFLVTEGI